MSNVESTYIFHAGTLYSDKQIQVVPDDMFKDFEYFRFAPQKQFHPDAWMCNKNITIKITTEIIIHQVK